MSSYLRHYDPLSGSVEWVEDSDYDLHQEIARASYADMLHDHERNEKYYQALDKAIKKMKANGRPANVLDIGTGTGLLSMMAVRLGADSVVACEAFLPMAKCAQEVIKENGFSDSIHLVPKRSTQMIVGVNGDMIQRANILVTEVFDSDFIGEGAIFTFKHALDELLEEDPIVVPASGRVFVQVIESTTVRRWRKLNDMVIDDNKVLKIPPSLEECPGTYSVHDLQLSQLPTDQFKTIVEPQVIFSFDFLGKIKLEFNRSNTVQCVAKNTGTAHAVFMWWDITMDTEGDILLSCAPHWAHPSPEAKNGPDYIPWRDHWMQEIYYFPKDVPVVKGDNLNLIGCHDEYGFWFYLTTESDKSYLDNVKLAQPACTCNLHNMVCSYSRIGMLNDPIRREKYLLALKRKINSDSVVLSVGDCSLLSLIAASLGAKKVYCEEACSFSRSVISEFVKTNNLHDKIEFVNDKIYEKKNLSGATGNRAWVNDVNLIITEPFFTRAFLPWHHLRWKPSGCATNCLMLPTHAVIWALPVSFDHLHKIRAPLHKVFDFSMSTFDQLVSKSSAISDSPIELQPLWEYGTMALSYPFKLFDFDLNTKHPQEDKYIKATVNVEATGRLDALVLWVEHKFDNDISISNGPVDVKVVEPGKKVAWDMYTKQAVCFVDLMNPVIVNMGDKLAVSSIYKWKDNDILLNIDINCGNGKEYKNISGDSSLKFSYFKTEGV